jgi:hypothetical protein
MTDGRLPRMVVHSAELSPQAAAEPAFLYRISAEKERRLGSRQNWRSFTGYRRKRNAGWVTTGTGVPHPAMGAVKNANWVGVGGRA